MDCVTVTKITKPKKSGERLKACQGEELRRAFSMARFGQKKSKHWAVATACGKP
jgi:hypothetical protein